MRFLTAVLLLGGFVVAWYLYQRLFAREQAADPDEPPRCDGCTGDNSCGNPNYACAIEARLEQGPDRG